MQLKGSRKKVSFQPMTVTCSVACMQSKLQASSCCPSWPRVIPGLPAAVPAGRPATAPWLESGRNRTQQGALGEDVKQHSLPGVRHARQCSYERQKSQGWPLVTSEAAGQGNWSPSRPQAFRLWLPPINPIQIRLTFERRELVLCCSGECPLGAGGDKGNNLHLSCKALEHSKQETRTSLLITPAPRRMNAVSREKNSPG